MPTPNNETDTATLPAHSGLQRLPRVPHTTCPPDDQRLINWRLRDDVDDTRTGILQPNAVSHLQTTATSDPSDSEKLDSTVRAPSDTPRIAAELESTTRDMLSPISSTSEPRETEDHPPPQGSLLPAGTSPTCGSSMRLEFSNVRLLPTSCSSFLRAGSKFRGTQQSDRQQYEVLVDLKHVDMTQSSLCGYLRIKGLTDDIPTLTTYFEGEIIGDRYSFQTKHPDWGSNDKIDMAHWWRFPAWRPLAKSAKKPDFAHRNFAQRENIFMRWKEHFLVPDHRVRTISGASFEGFYYICFNQVTGNISGIYFHAKSEKYQQLELTHVEDRGCFGAMEFR